MKIFLHKKGDDLMKQLTQKIVFENLLLLLRYRIFLIVEIVFFWLPRNFLLNQATCTLKRKETWIAFFDTSLRGRMMGK
jgi:hypothetical protein